VQIHNAITRRRGDEPTSLTPRDVLGRGGVLETFRELKQAGLARFLGITAIGEPASLREVVDSAEFATIQVPYSLLNPSAGREIDGGFPERNYGNIIAHAAKLGMGVFAIRVYAGGALAGSPPSPHTHRTKFFPLDLYQRDQVRADRLRASLPTGIGLPEAAIRFVLSHPQISSAIVGFSECRHVDQALQYAEHGPLPAELLRKLERLDYFLGPSNVRHPI
jgi:aryl-alcohol dehydrogenase-like predicted oxidoreductase